MKTKFFTEGNVDIILNPFANNNEILQHKPRSSGRNFQFLHYVYSKDLTKALEIQR